MKFYRGFATVGAMTIMSRVLGFARDVLIAAVLGTSYAADAFFVAFRVPNMFRRLFAEGAFDAAFIPLFATRLHTGVLNAFGRFAIAAFAPTLLNVVLIAVLLVFIASGSSNQSAAGVALAWGIAASGVLQVLVVAIAAAKLGMRLPWERPRLTPDMRHLAALAAPGIVAGGMAQLTVVIGTIIATLQDRVVSWLYYADRLFQLPLGVIGVAIGVVLLPTLSDKLRSGDHEAVLASENRALEFALLLTMPATIALFLAAEPIMRVLFERGAFTAVDTKATASMLAALTLGLPAYVLIKVLHPSFFAREDTKTPMIFAGISMAANIVLSFTLFMALGATGIAIATMLSGWINVALLVATLRRRERFKLDQTFRRRCAGILAASAVMGVVVFALVKLLDPWFAPASGLIAQGTALMTLVATGLLVYLGAAHLFGAAQFRDLIED